MSHPIHDTSNGSICLCPTCVDDISSFVTCLTTLPQARAVTSHVLEKHQSQLLRISALQAVLDEKDPVIEHLRQQLDTVQSRLQEYEVHGSSLVTAASPSPSSPAGQGHSRTSSTTSNASNHSTSEDDALTQIAQLKQMLRSERKKEHPAALRLRAAANEYANQAYAREMEAEEEASEWMWYAEKWRERVGELAECEQFLIDSQIWREMQEC